MTWAPAIPVISVVSFEIMPFVSHELLSTKHCPRDTPTAHPFSRVRRTCGRSRCKVTLQAQMRADYSDHHLGLARSSAKGVLFRDPGTSKLPLIGSSGASLEARE